MRQVMGEMHRVLPRAAADFKNLARTGEGAAQNLQDGILIAFARLREKQHGPAAVAVDQKIKL